MIHTSSTGKDIQNYYLNFKRLILMYSVRDLEHILNELLLFPLPMSHHIFFSLQLLNIPGFWYEVYSKQTLFLSELLLFHIEGEKGE